MSYLIHLQNISKLKSIPETKKLKTWAVEALKYKAQSAELTIRIVNKKEMSLFNQTYRKRVGPTNILSFPFEAPPGAHSYLLGDIVICADVVAQEAQEQHKPLRAHWAHMTIHGMLHLLGYDHVTEALAKVMEPLETHLLQTLGFKDPYEHQ